MSNAQKSSDTILTVTISPAVNGKRRVIVSGAPEKEMPVVRAGAFADLHPLIDEVWIELQKRKPQVVTVKSENAKTTKTAKAAKEDESDQLDAEEKDDAPDPVEKALDDAGANDTGETPAGIDEAQLPIIEGDSSTPSSLRSDSAQNEATNG